MAVSLEEYRLLITEHTEPGLLNGGTDLHMPSVWLQYCVHLLPIASSQARGKTCFGECEQSSTQSRMVPLQLP